MTERDYQSLVERLDKFIDLVGEDEEHPFVAAMEVLADKIERFENARYPDITETC